MRIQQGLASVAAGNGRVQQGVIDLEDADVITEDQAAAVLVVTRDIAEAGLRATQLSGQLPDNQAEVLDQIDQMIAFIQATSLDEQHPIVAAALELLQANLDVIRNLVEVSD